VSDGEDGAADDTAGTGAADSENGGSAQAGATPDSGPRHAAATPHRRRRRAGWIAVSAVLVVVLLAVGAVGFYTITLNNGLGSVQRGGDVTLPSDQNTPSKPTTGRAVNFLLLGSDSRDPDAADGRSDTLMLMHLDADRHHAYLISFPRDMWVSIPGKGKGKINWAFAYGGTALTAKTITSLVGVPIDHAALIDFEGFIKLTTTLGGVTVDNDRTFTTRGYTFPKGKITISGEQALIFVRDRYNQPNGDFGRAANQRKVVKAILSKALSPATIANPITFSNLVNQVAQCVTVDSGLSNAEIRSLALSLRMGPSDLITLQAPVLGTGMVGDQSVDFVDFAQLSELAKALQDDTMANYVTLYPPD